MVVNCLYEVLTGNVHCLLGPKAILDGHPNPPQLCPDDHRIGAGELILSANNSNSTTLRVEIYRLPAAVVCCGTQ